MNGGLLKIDSVSYSYAHSDWKLDSVEIGVDKGDFVGIAGANGSGKSTLLKIAGGILTPTGGTVTLEDKPIRKIPRKKLARSVGYLPQQVYSVFDYSVEEVVSMGRFCHSRGLGVTTSEDRKIVNECMESTETAEFRGRSIAELSGGERQRVLLASVLAQQPDIMLLDEPVTGLDLHHQVKFFKLLARFSAGGIAVLVITHDLNLAGQFCGKVLLMNRGKKEIFAEPEAVFSRIEQSRAYTGEVAFFRHPLNNKPAVLPYNNPDQRDSL